jgi:hypothetical protein
MRTLLIGHADQAPQESRGGTCEVEVFRHVPSSSSWLRRNLCGAAGRRHY